MRGGARVVGRGTAVALAVALPLTLVAQVLEALRGDGSDPGAVTYLFALGVLAGVALGGWTAGVDARRTTTTRAGALSALAGLAAVAVVLAVGVTRRTVAGDDVAWATVPTTAAVATALAAVAGTLGALRAGRTRS